MSVFDSNEDSSKENSVPQSNQYTPRTYEEYQELRKKAPHLYYSNKIQQRLYADADKIGRDAFFTKSKSKSWWEE